MVSASITDVSAKLMHRLLASHVVCRPYHRSRRRLDPLRSIHLETYLRREPHLGRHGSDSCPGGGVRYNDQKVEGVEGPGV